MLIKTRTKYKWTTNKVAKVFRHHLRYSIETLAGHLKDDETQVFLCKKCVTAVEHLQLAIDEVVHWHNSTNSDGTAVELLFGTVPPRNNFVRVVLSRVHPLQ